MKKVDLLRVTAATMRNSDHARMTGMIKVTIGDGIHFADLQNYKGGKIEIELDENGDVLTAVVKYK